MTRNHQLYLGLISGQAHNSEEIGNIVVKNVNNAPIRIRDIGTVERATAPVYHRRERQWETGGSGERQPPTGQQHRRR